MYKPHYPDWRYTRIKIDDLEQIKTELTSLFWKMYDHSKSFQFLGFDHNSQHWKQLPILQNWLNANNKIKDRWASCYFSIVNNGSCPIHVDYTKPDKCIAINIPLIDCDDSWTVWYEADIDTSMPIKSILHDNQSQNLLMPDEHEQSDKKYVSGYNSFWCQENIAKEIDRARCDTPMIVNISIPHRPVVDHQRLRVLFTLRLIPCDFEQDVLPWL